MSTEYTLVTYTCLHFALLPTSSTTDFTGTFERLSEPLTASHDLKRKFASSHLAIPTHCENFDCYHITRPEWEERIPKAVGQLRGIQNSFHDVFMKLGKVYHGIPLDTRVDMSGERVCALAHRQFGIEKRPWKEDPFFKPYLEARTLIRQIERAANWDAWTTENLAEIATMINRCRAMVSKVSGFESEIVAGINKLHRVYTDQVNAEMEALNEMNAKNQEETERRRVARREKALAERKKKEDEEKKRMEEEYERMLIQQAAEKAKGGLMGWITGRYKKALTLADSPKPKVDQPLRPEGKKVEAVAKTVEQPKKERRRSSSRKRETKPREKRAKDKGIKKKTMLRNAVLRGFLDRMDGF